jgi:hypothetical protein
MRYKVVVSGRGAECYVHLLEDEQRQKLFESEVENGDCEPEVISEIVNKNDIFETDDIFLGPFNNPEHFMILVYNENDDLIWESKNDHEFEDYDFEYIFEDDKSLIIEDYTKGQFFQYDIELDEEFDSKKLKPIVTEIGDRVEIITNFTYNETDLSFFKEYGDYWSKGLTYYLN